MYDLPSDVAKFIHRAGRTARVGRDGQVSCLVQSHEVDQYRALHEGEALPGTALHRFSGRAGVAAPADRVKPAEQRGWLALGDLSTAERSFAVDGGSSDFASAVHRQTGLGGVADGGAVYTHGEDDDPRLRGPPPDEPHFGRLKDTR